jgi:hypothetical protein
MSPPIRLAGCLALAMLCTSQGSGQRNDDPEARFLRTGMTQEDVRKLWGPPKRLARQILYHRFLEQWLYTDPAEARLEFECVKGEAPRLVLSRAPQQ